MQSVTQPQANRQEPLPYNGAFSRNVYIPRVPDSMTLLDFTDIAAQSSTNGSIPVPNGPGIGHRSGGDLIPGYEFNYMARTWEAPAHQPNNSSASMPSAQNENIGQGETNHAGEYAAPNNQGAFPVWRLFNGWVSYATQDEVHVTIALTRIPTRSPDRFRR